jgi:hypothetical protein
MDTEEESSYSGEEEEVCTLLGDPRETYFSWRILCVWPTSYGYIYHAGTAKTCHIIRIATYKISRIKIVF